MFKMSGGILHTRMTKLKKSLCANCKKDILEHDDNEVNRCVLVLMSKSILGMMSE